MVFLFSKSCLKALSRLKIKFLLSNRSALWHTSLEKPLNVRECWTVDSLPLGTCKYLCSDTSDHYIIALSTSPGEY